MEDKVKEWLGTPEIQKEIAKIVDGLVTDSEVEELTVEVAQKIAPPPPPAETNLGYHQQLDAKRPETLLEYLQ